MYFNVIVPISTYSKRWAYLKNLTGRISTFCEYSDEFEEYVKFTLAQKKNIDCVTLVIGCNL